MATKNKIAVSPPSGSSVPALVRVQSFWQGLAGQQRVYLVVGLAITLAVLVFLGRMVANPAYKPLMTGLDPADAQVIAGQLAAKKIPCLVSPDGTSLSVPADQVDAARLEVAAHDTPHSGRIGFEIFDKVSWGETEFDERVNYQRALEGELERTIQTISNVKTARVHLVMASDSVFTDRERGAKASVTLRLKGGSLSRDEVSQIARLVAGAVDELKPADVVIVDADSNQALGMGNNLAGGDQEMEQGLTRQLIATLAPVVGADSIRATVNVEYETGSSEESQEKYDPAVSATLNMQNSEETSTPGAGIGGVPGTSSNVPSGKPVVAPAAGGKTPATATPATAVAVVQEPGDSSKTTSATYGVNKITRHVIQPAGGIRRITAAVLLDDATERKLEKGKWVVTHYKRSPEQLKLITDLAQAAIGFNSARGDVISVQDLAFDRAAPMELPPATLMDKARKGVDDYASVFRYAGLVALFFVVYLFAIRPIQKRALAPPDPQLVLARAAANQALEAAPAAETAGHLALRSQELKKQLADFVRAEPESSTTAVRAWLREEAP
jgi:flagellar M-ring protein FliF